ncbi:MAG TPA: hypothetical protein VFQ36_04575 [Ktedonobacteraceae bacterium]|nr:hypothetical protein [Ktedonobacteraceae bacterium]
MHNSNEGAQRAFLFWLSGLPFADIAALPEVEKLEARGVRVDLTPLMMSGTQSQHYQVLSGKSPARFGFFDTLMPLARLARPASGESGYTIVEEQNGRDAAPRLLPDILRKVGWSVRYEEIQPGELQALVEHLPLETPAASCTIIKISIDAHPLSATLAASLAEALRIAHEWVGDTGLLALLCDAQPARVKRFVNINNFLADMGIIERDEQSGHINWANSLAYFAGHGQLWVNLLGRDPQGAVHPQDEYEEVRETLVKALPSKVRDAATGEAVVERVYRKEELYVGDYLFCAPDLVVQFKPGYAPSPRSTRLDFDEQVITVPEPGTMAVAGLHPEAIKGYLLATAPALASGLSLSAPLTAVAPTLLHALGVEHEGMDEAALSFAFTSSYLEAHPVRSNAQNQELSDEDEELVINRLRDLGYI